jgi:GH15 family glucan-1,4-alpha-glucosidase
LPRAPCVGNGNLQVNIDNDMNIRDLFFPLVGLENNIGGHFCSFGVGVDGRFSWVDSSWNRRFGYEEDSLVRALVFKTTKLSLNLKLLLSMSR